MNPSIHHQETFTPPPSNPPISRFNIQQSSISNPAGPPHTCRLYSLTPRPPRISPKTHTLQFSIGEGADGKRGINFSVTPRSEDPLVSGKEKGKEPAHAPPNPKPKPNPTILLTHGSTSDFSRVTGSTLDDLVLDALAMGLTDSGHAILCFSNPGGSVAECVERFLDLKTAFPSIAVFGGVGVGAEAAAAAAAAAVKRGGEKEGGVGVEKLVLFEPPLEKSQVKKKGDVEEGKEESLLSEDSSQLHQNLLAFSPTVEVLFITRSLTTHCSTSAITRISGKMAARTFNFRLEEVQPQEETEEEGKERRWCGVDVLGKMAGGWVVGQRHLRTQDWTYTISEAGE